MDSTTSVASLPDTVNRTELNQANARLIIVLEWIQQHLGKIPDDLVYTLKTSEGDKNLVNHEEDPSGTKILRDLESSGTGFENQDDELSEEDAISPIVLYESDFQIETHKNSNFQTVQTQNTSEPNNLFTQTDEANKIQFYKCSLCASSFTSISNLSIHSLVHCDVRIRSMGINKKNLDLILRFPHTFQIRCLNNELQISKKKIAIRSNFKKLQVNHSPPNVICTDCGKCFRKQGNLNRHMRQVHESKPSEEHCSPRDKSFGKSANLRKHIKTVRADSNDAETCHICDKTFASQLHLRRHYKKTHPDPSLACKCEICGKECKSAAYLRGHMARVHVEKTFLCQDCGLTVKTKQALKVHTERMHMKPHIRKYKCTYCPSVFKTSYDLKCHVNRHLGKNMSHCPHCRILKSKTDLYNHISIVHKGRKFKCNYCAALFSLRAFLKDHFKLKHEGLPVPPDSEIEVVLTGNAEKTSSSFSDKIHKRTRNLNIPKFECSICSVMFRLRARYDLHMLKHQKDPAYRFVPKISPIKRILEADPQHSGQNLIPDAVGNSFNSLHYSNNGEIVIL